MVLPSRYAVNETEAYLHCGLEGLGLIQLSALAASPHLRSGRLREVLADAVRAGAAFDCLSPGACDSGGEGVRAVGAG